MPPIFLLSLTLLSADTIHGRVHDAAGHVIPNAEVIAQETGRLVLTGDDGRFAVAAPAGVTLTVRHAGYATRTVQPVTSDEVVDVVLEPSPFLLDQVNVTAVRAPISTEVSLATSTLGREELRREAGVSLAHELNTLPGVHTLSTGEQVGKPVIRGLYGSRVLVLEDAMRLEDYSWSDEDAPSIDARFADRVEVVRGPASILYGSDAIGGVINAVQAPVPQPGSNFSRSGIELSGSSNRSEAGIVLRNEGSARHVGWRALLVGHFAEDFKTPSGPVENTGYGALNGEVAAAMQPSWGDLTLRYARYGGEFKLLEKEGPAEQPGAEEEGPERKLSDDRVQIVAAIPLGAVRLETRAQWQRHWLQEVADELTPEPGQPKREAPVFELLSNTLSAEVLAHHRTGTAGVSLVAQNNDSRGVLPVVPDASVRKAGAYVLERISTGSIDWLAGARADHYSIDPTATKGLATNASESSDAAFTYNLGFVVHLGSALALRANAGRAWRTPNLFELYASGPRIGEARYEIGDPALASEESLEIDAGAQLGTERVTAEVTVFDNRVDRFIALTPTAEMHDGLRVFRHEQRDAELKGMEASVDVRASESVRIGAEYDEVRASWRADDTPLPWIPAPRAQGYAEYARDAGATDGWYTRATVEHVWPKARTAANEPGLDAYTLLGVAAGLRTQVRSHELHIDASIRNVTNESYREFLNRYRDFALNPGRDVTVRLSVDL